MYPHKHGLHIKPKNLNLLPGYWRKPAATKETLTPDGWLKSGDICYVNEAGRFFIVDRKKELIKVKGNQVAPAELEGLLLEHPAIADAAVVGVTVDGEEYPRAYVVKSGEVSEAAVVDFMKGKTTRVKWITGGVRFVDTIVKNPSGKILRKELRELAKKEVASEGIPRAKL